MSRRAGSRVVAPRGRYSRYSLRHPFGEIDKRAAQRRIGNAHERLDEPEALGHAVASSPAEHLDDISGLVSHDACPSVVLRKEFGVIMAAKTDEIQHLMTSIDDAIGTTVKLHLTTASYLLKMAKLELQMRAEDDEGRLVEYRRCRNEC